MAVNMNKLSFSWDKSLGLKNTTVAFYTKIQTDNHKPTPKTDPLIYSTILFLCKFSFVEKK